MRFDNVPVKGSKGTFDIQKGVMMAMFGAWPGKRLLPSTIGTSKGPFGRMKSWLKDTKAQLAPGMGPFWQCHVRSHGHERGSGKPVSNVHCQTIEMNPCLALVPIGVIVDIFVGLCMGQWGWVMVL